MARLVTITSSLALVAVIAVGVAVADSGYGAGKGSQGLKDYERSQVAVTAYLTGAAEINEEGQDGAGDPGAKGTATLFVADRQTVCYGFAVRGAEAPTAMHVHRGAAGQNGAPVIDFSKGAPKDANGQPAGDPGASSGCKVLEGAEKAALARILTNPKNYYVNMHTASFPNGALRGQLSRMLYDND